MLRPIRHVHASSRTYRQWDLRAWGWSYVELLLLHPSSSFLSCVASHRSSHSDSLRAILYGTKRSYSSAQNNDVEQGNSSSLSVPMTKPHRKSGGTRWQKRRIVRTVSISISGEEDSGSFPSWDRPSLILPASSVSIVVPPSLASTSGLLKNWDKVETLMKPVNSMVSQHQSGGYMTNFVDSSCLRPPSLLGRPSSSPSTRSRTRILPFRNIAGSVL